MSGGFVLCLLPVDTKLAMMLVAPTVESVVGAAAAATAVVVAVVAVAVFVDAAADVHCNVGACLLVVARHQA